MALLKIVALAPEPVSLSEAARRAKLAPSTALRHLRSLEHSGLVARSETDSRFAPGRELLRIAKYLAPRANLAALGRWPIRELADDTGESAYLAERSESDTAVYVAVAESSRSVRHTSWLGKELVLGSTAVGQALSGGVGRGEVVVVVDAVEEGTTAVASPIMDPRGVLLGAVNLVALSYRIDRETLDSLIARVAATARSIEASFAGSEPGTG